MAADYDYKKKFRGWINPAEEPLWAKIIEIDETLDILEKQQMDIVQNVSPDAAGYVYAVLAVSSGFAADKVLKGMIDRVLKRLEEKAEKTKETRDAAR